MPSILPPANDPAGDFCAGISRRLRTKIIGFLMNNHCFAYNVADTETVCPHSKKRIPAARHQRRQIACVIGMRFFVRIIVTVCIGKISSGTGLSIVNVHSVKFRPFLGKSGKFYDHQNPAALLEKLYLSR